MKRFAVSLFVVLCTCSVSSAGGYCFPLTGSVLLEAEPPGTCSIAGIVPGPTYLGALGMPAACFKVKLRGLLPGSGFAGLTAEWATNLLDPDSVTATPLLVHEGGLPVPRQIITARTVLNVAGGSLYSADVGLISAGGVVEQILITGGTGFYAGATGSLLVTGDSTKDWAPFRGQVCVGGATP